jgi:hypothetical protein
MKQRHWREMVEIIGVLSIVASVLLLASEVRQSNQIARAEVELSIADLHNQLNLMMATDTDFAKLYAKTRNPASHLLTATDLVQIDGLAWHSLNTYLMAQTAFDHALIDQEALNNYKTDIAELMESNPALAKKYIEILGQFETFQNEEVLEAVSQRMATQRAAPAPAD